MFSIIAKSGNHEVKINAMAKFCEGKKQHTKTAQYGFMYVCVHIGAVIIALKKTSMKWE